MGKPIIFPGALKRLKQFMTGKYIEDTNTASQNIAAGKYVIWKNQMCQAKTAITAGDTLSSTNLDAVGDEGAVNALDSNFLITVKKYTINCNTSDGQSFGYIGYNASAISAEDVEQYGTPFACYGHESSMYQVVAFVNPSSNGKWSIYACTKQSRTASVYVAFCKNVIRIVN